MPEIKPFPLIETAVLENTAVSPAIADIIERAHKGTDDILVRFKREHMGVVLPLLSDFNAYIGYMLGTKTANPADFSRMISAKRKIKEQETAANDAVYKTQKAA